MEKKIMTLKEAHRVIHNMHCQYEALGLLKEALAYSENLEKTIKAQEADSVRIAEANSKVFSELQAAEFRLESVKKEYAVESREKASDMRKRIDKLKEKRDDEDRKLKTFLVENQGVINKIKRDTELAEEALRNRKAKIAAEIEALNTDRRKAERALTNAKARMEAILNG